MNADYLNQQFLIAMPMLKDSHFEQSVTLLCEHNDEGAMGIVINRPSEVALSELLDHLGYPVHDAEIGGHSVYLGGPVRRDHGFVLHDGETRWPGATPIAEGINLTTSRDILRDIARGEGPVNFLVALGYAGWGAGQLENEITENAWLNAPLDGRVLFELPYEQRWHAAAGLAGVDISRLAPHSGHA